MFFFKNSYENFLVLFDLYLPNEKQCPLSNVSDAMLITTVSGSISNIIWQKTRQFWKLYYSISVGNSLKKRHITGIYATITREGLTNGGWRQEGAGQKSWSLLGSSFTGSVRAARCSITRGRVWWHIISVVIIDSQLCSTTAPWIARTRTCLLRMIRLIRAAVWGILCPLEGRKLINKADSFGNKPDTSSGRFKPSSVFQPHLACVYS